MTTTITAAHIICLRDEQAINGNAAMASLCNKALSGDTEADARVRKFIQLRRDIRRKMGR